MTMTVPRNSKHRTLAPFVLEGFYFSGGLGNKKEKLSGRRNKYHNPKVCHDLQVDSPPSFLFGLHGSGQ